MATARKYAALLDFMMKRAKVAKVATLAACLCACGPIQYISQVTTRASDAVSAARAANAETLAPYEFTSAVEFLHKAREEEGYANHQTAVRFGKVAETMARRARQIALGGGPSSDPASEPVPVAAPVKAARATP